MKQYRHRNPPMIAEYLLGKILPDGPSATPLGDFEEYYNELSNKDGMLKARMWYWGQVFNLLPRKILNSFLWGFLMFNNYFKIAVRNMLKSKVYSIINISGLALGMACSLLILLYVQKELSYDKFHKNADDIYRIEWISENPQTRTPHPMAMAMKDDFPEVVDAVTMSPLWGPGLSIPTFSVRYGDKVFDESGFFSADTTFFDFFSFKLVQGNKKTAMQTIGGIIITEKIAHKYFGNENPIGKQLRINEDPNFSPVVTGVMQNIPDNSHFHFNFLFSYMTMKAHESPESQYYTWNDFGHFNYIKLKEGTDPKTVEAKIPEWSRQYLPWDDQTYEALKQGIIGFKLDRMTDIHLHSNIRWELEPNGDITYVYVFMSAAFLILLIACINFTNLTIARAMKRSKEIGVRKVLGGERKQLFMQFFGETLLSSVIALMLAIILTYLFLPAYGNIINKEITFASIMNNGFLSRLLLIAVVATIVAGAYPALFLSGIQPVSILKGKQDKNGKIQWFGKALVVLQFTISLVLIIGAQVISSQLDFLSNKNLGFNKEQILVAPMKNSSMRKVYNEIKNELLRHESIISASAVSNVPGTSFNQNDIRWESDENRTAVAELYVDEDFIKTMGIEIKEGRDFSRDHITDLEQHNFILNEAAEKCFNWKTPVGEDILWLGDMFQCTGKVIGVVKDFNFRSLHNSIEPLLIQIYPNAFNYMLIKISPNNVSSTIKTVEDIWKRYDSDHSFEYSFLDDTFNKQYRAEEQMKTLFSYFTALAVFIACMGLFGLSLLTIEKRIKEIGVRKTLGASVPSVVRLILTEYVKLIVIANVIAWPVAYYFMHDWLQGFAYKTDISLLIFLGSGFMVLFVTVATVIIQALKAAYINPVVCLKEE